MTQQIFTYTDHLTDTEIDLTEYLVNFSDDNYTLKFSNLQPVKTTIKNLFSRSDLVDAFKERGASFQYYNILDNELPEDVAIKWYGKKEYWWIIFLFNDISNGLTDWPLSDEQILHVVDILTEKEDKYSKEGYFLLLQESNDNKRQIELLNNDQVAILINDFRNMTIQSTGMRTSTTTVI